MPKKVLITLVLEDEEYREIVNDLGFSAGDLPDSEAARLLKDDLVGHSKFPEKIEVEVVNV